MNRKVVNEVKKSVSSFTFLALEVFLLPCYGSLQAECRFKTLTQWLQHMSISISIEWIFTPECIKKKFKSSLSGAKSDI